MKPKIPSFSISRLPLISLDQWAAFVAVVDFEGYAKASEKLHKSQSAITYAVKKMEDLLEVELFRIEGRKAQLTDVGRLLYSRGKVLLEDARDLETAAQRAVSGWESEIHLAVEILFPPQLLQEALAQFNHVSPQTSIEIHEAVLSGTVELILKKKVDLAISPSVPAGMLGIPLIELHLIPVAHPEHPLHHLGSPLKIRDLRKHCHLLVRDTGQARNSSGNPVNSQRRWIFSQFDTSIQAARAGHGFAWYPKEKIANYLADGTLKELVFEDDVSQVVALYLVTPHEEIGLGVQALRDALRQACKNRATDSVDHPTA